MLWKRVNEASPHLLDEHLLTFTLRPSCCILTAQKGPKYRDTLLIQHDSTANLLWSNSQQE